MNMKFVVSSTLILAAAVLFTSCGGGGSAPSGNMLVTANWGDDTVRITDDIDTLADNTFATPRIISGANTSVNLTDFDSVAIDSSTNTIYVSDAGNILVFDALTATGDITPERLVDLAGNSTVSLDGIEIDESRDRLYVVGIDGDGPTLWIYDNASTRDGALVPDEDIALTGGTSVAYDATNDRLYVCDFGPIYVFNNASTLTTGATPDRTITFTSGGAFDVAIDPTNDRLYMASRSASTGGNNIFVFANASTLDGSTDPDAASVARISLSSSMKLIVDRNDRLYVLQDSASRVFIFSGASTMTGDVADTPISIFDVVSSGYGMDYFAY